MIRNTTSTAQLETKIGALHHAAIGDRRHLPVEDRYVVYGRRPVRPEVGVPEVVARRRDGHRMLLAQLQHLVSCIVLLG
eukprot:4507298-Pyramimonas_sp.AAC.1